MLSGHYQSVCAAKAEFCLYRCVLGPIISVWVVSLLLVSGADGYEITVANHTFGIGVCIFIFERRLSLVLTQTHSSEINVLLAFIVAHCSLNHALLLHLPTFLEELLLKRIHLSCSFTLS